VFNALVILANPETAPMARAVVAASGLVNIVRELQAAPGRYELGRLLNTLAPDLVLIDLAGGAGALECASLVREFSPQTAIVGLGCSREARLLAMSAGLDAVTASGCSPEELQQAIRRALELHHDRIEPFLFSFLPAKAGSGCSTVVLNTAAALGALGRRTLVIDADLRSSVLGLMLGVEVYGGSQAVLAASAELDVFLLRRNLAEKHGADFLLSSRSLDAPVPEWAHYFQLLNFVRAHYDMVLVDLPELVNPATVEVIRRSARIFVVCTPELPSLHLALQRLAELDRLGLGSERTGILLNRVHGSDPPQAEIEKLLGRAVFHGFPNSYRAVAAAIRSASPVEAGSPLGAPSLPSPPGWRACTRRSRKGRCGSGSGGCFAWLPPEAAFAGRSREPRPHPSTPSLRRNVIIGHQFVKALWNRFSPTNAVNHSQRWSWYTLSARLSRMKNPAIIRSILSTVITHASLC
jgi:pilus assembly protein CpaE